MDAAGNRLKSQLIDRVTKLGFEDCRVTSAKLPLSIGDDLETYIAQGHHGSMDWMAETFERRKTPRAMWPQARSAIVLAMNYGPEFDPLDNLQKRDRATISVYARNRDYHDVIKGRLKTLAGWFTSKTGADVKVFVDTAPLMEKPLAAQAGLGWQGKHTNLVSRELGSWFFLGVILTDINLPEDEAEIDHCGSCRACLDICPTDAFPSPYRIDARRCISYLTIEHKGPIPHEFRERMGNRIYGCDDCLATCPWNKFAQTTREAKLAARDDLVSPELAELVTLNDAQFRKKFSGSPIKRIGRDRFIRNVLIAVGNSQAPQLKRHAVNLLRDDSPLVRGAAVWALSRLEDAKDFSDMRDRHLPDETDPTVRREWELPVMDLE